MSNTGVKLDPKKSRFQPKEKKKTQADFEREIAEYQKNSESLTAKVMQLSNRFMKAVDDKTLLENKGIGNDVEKELVNELAALALHINNDESQPEGIGSVGLITLLMNAMLSQRDRLNEQAYEIHLLKEQLKKSSTDES